MHIDHQVLDNFMQNTVDFLYKVRPPENARPLYSPEKTRQWMAENVATGFEHALNKIETNDYKLQVKNVKVDTKKSFSLADQKRAILERGDLSIPVKADVAMVDKKTGKTVEEKKGMTLATMPWITDRNTTVYNGNEYITTAQQRLKPGIYSRIKDNGEIEAHVSPEVGTGLGGKLIMDPVSAKFTFEVGTMNIPLYGLLKDLGVSDAEMEHAWGKDIFAKNKAGYKGNEIDKLYSKVFVKRF